MVALPPVIIDLTGPRVVYVIPDEPDVSIPQAALVPSQMQQAASATVEAAQMLCVLTSQSHEAHSASGDSTPTYSPLRPSEETPLRLRLKRRLPPVTSTEAPPLAKRSIATLRPATLRSASRVQSSPVPPQRQSFITAEKKLQKQLLRHSAESYAQFRRELRDRDYKPDESSDESYQNESSDESCPRS